MATPYIPLMMEVELVSKTAEFFSTQTVSPVIA